MMAQLIERFPAQLLEAIDIGRGADIRTPKKSIQKIVVTGMGGSGIGGNFVQSMIRNICAVPYLVNKSYDLPAYINEHTLLIASSYSGNTEETISAVHQAVKLNAQLIIISSGGQLIQFAQENGYDYILVPEDWPSPRACLGYSIVAQLFVLNKLNFINNELIDQVELSAQNLSTNQVNIKQKAEAIAKRLYNKTVVIYIEDRMEPVAIRLRQQINENAKDLCWHQVIPEMNHNELVGWKDKREDLVVLMMRNKDDYSRNKTRANIIKEIITPLTADYIELQSEGNSFVEQEMYWVHLGDWISWHLSQLRQVDSMEVYVIDYLKKELAKV